MCYLLAASHIALDMMTALWAPHLHQENPVRFVIVFFYVFLCILSKDSWLSRGQAYNDTFYICSLTQVSIFVTEGQ